MTGSRASLNWISPSLVVLATAMAPVPAVGDNAERRGAMQMGGGIWRDVVALVLGVLAYGGPALSVSVDDDAEA